MSGLAVSGRVENLLLLRFSDLLAITPQVEDVSSLAPGRKGSAVRLLSVLEKAGAQAAATHAVLISRDGAFTARVALTDMVNALLLYRLGKDPLPEKEGGPVRFLNPDAANCTTYDKRACANVKHLGAIELISIPTA